MHHYPGCDTTTTTIMPEKKNFKLEAVTVCINYADFLAHTLPHNRQLFDHYVVVTDTSDQETKNLCDFYNVECVQTDIFYANDDTLNKGVGINEGLKKLSLDGYVIHLDADIFLPPLTREILQRINLDETLIYGIDRMMCRSYTDWITFIESPQLMHEGWCYVHPTVFPMGTRVAEYKNTGYTPIGFFQLWHPIGSGVTTYPANHGGVDRSDIIMAKHWDRTKRQLIPEVICIHLDSQSEGIAKMGVNWKGRKTPYFGYQVNETIRTRSRVRFKIGVRQTFPRKVWEWIRELIYVCSFGKIKIE